MIVLFLAATSATVWKAMDSTPKDVARAFQTYFSKVIPVLFGKLPALKLNRIHLEQIFKSDPCNIKKIEFIFKGLSCGLRFGRRGCIRIVPNGYSV